LATAGSIVTRLVTLAAADDDLVGGELDVLDAESAALEDPQPGAVERACHEDGQRGEEAGDLRRPHLGGMALGLEEEDVPLDPRDVGFLGAPAVVASLQGGANAIEESRLRRGDLGGLSHDERPRREKHAGHGRHGTADGVREHDPVPSAWTGRG
jgi:hypothetical protein